MRTTFFIVVIGLLLVGGGVYALVKGEIPSYLFGDKGNKTEVAGARVIGVLLLMPVVLSLWSVGLGLLSILVVLFAVYFVNKATRKPIG